LVDSARVAQTKIRVLVVDDHPMIRDVIRLASRESSRIEIVGEAAEGTEALAQARALMPDVVVLDTGLPGIGGVEVARRLKAERGDAVHVLVLSDRDDPRAVFECRRIGVEGIFDKADSVDDVVSAIEAVADGRRVFTTDHDRMAHDELASMVRQARVAHRVGTSITPRELEVLRCISQGCTTRQTASRLGLSERTVESHIAKLYSKLGARTRIQAAVQATRLGLLDGDRQETDSGLERAAEGGGT
jgi:DNA-binding NarL/FixJ family response regulator